MVDITIFELHLDGSEFTATAPWSGASESGGAGDGALDPAIGAESGTGGGRRVGPLGLVGLVGLVAVGGLVAVAAVRRLRGGDGPTDDA